MIPLLNLRIASLILAASTVVSSSIVLLVGDIVPRFFAIAFHIQSASDLDMLIPPITKFAARHAWIFASTSVLVCLAVVILMRRSPSRVIQFVALGLSAQALVVWVAMFCYCYDGLTGTMCMHHGAEFEFGQFFQFAFGIFPLTLCAIIAPGLAALLLPKERNV